MGPKKNLFHFGNEKTWIRIGIRIETNTVPKHCFMPSGLPCQKEGED